MMTGKKIIAVLGATGDQGNGLCNAILTDAETNDFTCRALTRDPGKDSAQSLAEKGAEIVRADIDDIDSLKRAFAGAHGVYAVTDFWEHLSAEKEKLQAKNIAEAARSAGVSHVIWSTLEDTRELMSADDKRMPFLQENYRVPHFDGKAEANSYFSDLPVTYLVTSFYWDNLYKFGLSPKRDNGQYSWALPMADARIAGIAAEDIGKAAYSIFKAGQPYIGKTVGIVGETLTIDEISQELSEALGVGPVTYKAVDADTFRDFGFPGADELGNMFQIYRDFEDEVLARRSIEETRKLNPDVQSFKQFVIRRKDAILSAMNN